MNDWQTAVETSPRSAATSFQRPSKVRERLIDSLAKKFYVDEQGVCVSNGLSTELICFPSDKLPDHEDYLKDKIQSAMSYATRFKDVVELNALKYIAPHERDKAPDHYLTLGLYLYLADECSRLNKDKTFLSAMREAKAALPPEEEYSSDELLQRAKHALTILGMQETHGKLLDDWHQNGSYTIDGDIHMGDGAPQNLTGKYALLAREVSQRQKYLGMNSSISYALGNRSKIEGKSDFFMNEYTQNLLRPENGHLIDELIAEGNATREERIREKIKEAVPEPDISYLGHCEKNIETARKVLSLLPDAVLKLLDTEGYMFAYANDKDIRNCYPKNNLPDVSKLDNESARGGKALQQPRYRMIFLSNGIRRDGYDIGTDDDLRSKVVAQSLLHETAHIIVSHLKPDEKKELRQAVESVSQELEFKKGYLPGYFNRNLSTIDTNTLAEVVDYQDSGIHADGKFGHYRNYVKYKPDGSIGRDTRWEEVACNVLGLMHTDFPYPPNAGEPNPYADLPSLDNLARKINHMAELAVERSHETSPPSHGRSALHLVRTHSNGSGVGR